MPPISAVGRRIGLGARPPPVAHERVVVQAVPAALELQNLLAPRGDARDPDRVHGRLGARAHEAHLVAARRGLADHLRQADGGLAQPLIRRAPVDLRLHGRGERGMRVAEQERPRAERIVDEAPAVRVDEVTALGAIDHEADLARQRPHPARAAGQVALRRLDQIVPMLLAHRGSFSASAASSRKRSSWPSRRRRRRLHGRLRVVDRGGAVQSHVHPLQQARWPAARRSCPSSASRPLSRMYPDRAPS